MHFFFQCSTIPIKVINADKWEYNEDKEEIDSD